jgi:predicted transcriptional regulator
MPGIAKLDLDLGHGGHGAGQKTLQRHAEAKRGNKEQTVVKLLLQGPKHISEIGAALGGPKSRGYSVMNALRKQGVTEASQGHGMHQLTAKARAQLRAALPALPAPDVKKTPSGRIARGSGAIVLRAALATGPVSPADLRRHMESNGMSRKSVSGALERAKKHGLIKKNGDGYELTAKGQKMNVGVANNG